MNPLPDRVVILSLAISVLLCFALAFWTARLHPPQQDSLQWRDAPKPATRQVLPADGV